MRHTVTIYLEKDSSGTSGVHVYVGIPTRKGQVTIRCADAVSVAQVRAVLSRTNTHDRRKLRAALRAANLLARATQGQSP